MPGMWTEWIFSLKFLYNHSSVLLHACAMFICMRVCTIIMCVPGLQWEDYCRFTRPANNEQTHPGDPYSITITMKRC